MRGGRCTVAAGMILSVCLLLPGTPPAVGSAQQENHCFTCHTNPRKLIEITREIARADKDKPGASIATEGEG